MSHVTNFTVMKYYQVVVSFVRWNTSGVVVHTKFMSGCFVVGAPVTHCATVSKTKKRWIPRVDGLVGGMNSERTSERRRDSDEGRLSQSRTICSNAASTMALQPSHPKYTPSFKPYRRLSPSVLVLSRKPFPLLLVISSTSKDIIYSEESMEYRNRQVHYNMRGFTMRLLVLSICASERDEKYNSNLTIVIVTVAAVQAQTT